MDADESNLTPAAAARGLVADARAGGGRRSRTSGSCGRSSSCCAAGPVRPRGVPLLAAPDRGAAGLPLRASGSLGAGEPRVALLAVLAWSRSPSRTFAAVGRPAERLLPARHVRQREPGRARDAPIAWRRRARGHEGRRPAGLIVVRRARRWSTSRSRTTPTFDRPQAQVGGRGTNIAQAIQLALAIAAARPGQPHRPPDRRAPERRQGADGGAGGQGRRRRHLLRARRRSRSRRRSSSSRWSCRKEVKFGEPFQAKVVAWSQAETQGPALAVPERRVPRLAGGAPQRRARTSSRTASRSSRAASTSTRRGRGRRRHHRGEQPRGRAPSWCAAGRRCSWPTRSRRRPRPWPPPCAPSTST